MVGSLFWDDDAPPPPRGSLKRLQVLAPIPDTGWTTPREFPNLRGASHIAVDLETYDPDLLTHGPGWARGVGHIVGISIAVPGASWYFPMRHTVEPEHNLEPARVLAWANDMLSGNAYKVGANLIYDLGWLREEGVIVGGRFVDIQLAEALLSERDPVNLDAMAEKYLGQRKETSALYAWLAESYGGEPGPAQRGNIYRAPPRLVGPYAQSDTELPLAMLPHLHTALVQRGALSLFDLECDLIPLLLDMRFAGVSVDTQHCVTLRAELAELEQQKSAELAASCGFRVNVNSGESVAAALDREGTSYPRTAKGAPSLRKDWLKNTDTPVTRAVNEIRQLIKLRSAFVEGALLNSQVRGKVYGQFNQLRDDEGGTRSGRFSGSNPNLQQIPKRGGKLAKRIREAFVPDPGHARWVRFDYSQIEYRLLVHFAVGPGAEEARAAYSRDAHTDYHNYVIAMVAEIAGVTLEREPGKTFNFGMIYGMGKGKLVSSLGVAKAVGLQLYDAYNRAIPYARATMQTCADEANRFGYVETILGRRSDFDLWEPADFDDSGAYRMPLSLNEALRFYGSNIRRAHLHKALNRKLQGSAADMMKVAMRDVYRSGVCAYIGVPRLTVHDELGWSDPGGPHSDDAFREVRRIMQSCLPLRVPVIAEAEAGPSWGKCSAWNL